MQGMYADLGHPVTSDNMNEEDIKFPVNTPLRFELALAGGGCCLIPDKEHGIKLSIF